jgi:hypothetical protein
MHLDESAFWGCDLGKATAGREYGHGGDEREHRGLGLEVSLKGCLGF